MATYADPERVQQSIGPPITSALDFAAGDEQGLRFVIEDDGLPNVLANALRACLESAVAGLGRDLLEGIEALVRADPHARNMMVWLGTGADAADGELTLAASMVLAVDDATRPAMAPRAIRARRRRHHGGAPAPDARRPAASRVAGRDVHAVEHDADAASARRLRDGRHGREPAW